MKFTWKKNCQYEWAPLPKRPKMELLPTWPWQMHACMVWACMVPGGSFGAYYWQYGTFGGFLLGWGIAVAIFYLMVVLYRVYRWRRYFYFREKRYFKRLMRDYGRDPVAMSIAEHCRDEGNRAYESIYEMLNSFY